MTSLAEALGHGRGCFGREGVLRCTGTFPDSYEALLLTTIGSSASSRQAVAGRPGIGKATLVQTVKADAQDGGYWSSAEIIPISSWCAASA